MKKGKLFPLSSPYSVFPDKRANDHRIRSTGEYRNPRKGEWFISGAIPEGYLAPSDLSFPYFIGELVKVKIKTVVTVIEEPKEIKDMLYVIYSRSEGGYWDNELGWVDEVDSERRKYMVFSKEDKEKLHLPIAEEVEWHEYGFRI